MRPLISVIMPARNVEDYVQEAIEAVLKQKGVSFELLLVDDASTDKTWTKVQLFGHHPAVRLWRLNRRRGAAGARNFLLRAARGTYIAPCDADDKILPGYLKELYLAFHKKKSVGVVFLEQFIDRVGGATRLTRKIVGPDKAWDLLGEGSVSHPGTMIRRSLLNKVGGYDANLPFLHDYDLFLRLAEVTKFLCLKNKPLFCYRSRKGSISDCSRRDFKKVYQTVVRRAIFRRYQLKVIW